MSATSSSRRAGRVRQLAVPGGILLAFALIALFAPLLAPYSPTAQPDIVGLKSMAPSWAHPFGTDPYSRDVLSRVMYGGRVSLSVALFATTIAVTLGTIYGAIAGYAGGWLDTLMMRVVDAGLAMPRVVLLIALLAVWRTFPTWALVLVIGATGWFGLSRLVRGQVMAFRRREFVVAAQALGAPRRRIIFRHILPNVLPTIIVAAALGIGQVIVLEAGLSFLGIGVHPPAASWGNIIQDGADQVGTLWWMSVFPGMLIVITAIAANALGDRLDKMSHGDTRALDVATGGNA